MSEINHTPPSELNAEHQQSEPEQLPEPQKKKKRWKPLLIWIIPLVALLIGASLAIKAVFDRGPRIEVAFRTAEGLTAGQTTVRFRQVDIGLVREIDIADDDSHVIVKIDLRKDASHFAAKDSRFWVVRPRIGTGGISGIGTLLSGAYIEVDGGESKEKQEHFEGLETPPVVSSDVPGKVFFLKARDLGSLDIGSPIYYRRINVGQITAFKLSDDGQDVELQTYIRTPYDKFVTTDARFWQASGVDVSLNASGFNLDTQSLATIIAGGIAFGYPEDSNANTAPNNSHFQLWNSRTDAMKDPDGVGRPVVMYFNQSLRGLSAGSPINFMGIDIGSVTGINVEFSQNYSQLRMRVDGIIYPSRLANGQEIDPDGLIFKRFIERGWRAQMRTGNLLTGQNYIALDQFSKVKPASLINHKDGPTEIPTTQSELSGLQQQVSEIADKINKFPLNEIAADARKTLKSMNKTLETTDRLVHQLDAKTVPSVQATLDDVRTTVRSTDSILSSDAPLQQDLRQAIQQMTRTAASLQIMADYIEQHPESLIRGKTNVEKRSED